MEKVLYRISVVYHQRPDKAMRALNFFNRRPTLFDKPMLANSVFLVDQETLDANKVELDRYQRDGIIEIRDREGQPFRFPHDDTCIPGLLTEDELVSRELVKAQASMRMAPQSKAKEGVDPELPPPLEEEQQASINNDDFFADVRAHAEKTRPKRKKRAAEG